MPDQLLDAVVDMDCVVSTNPLVFGMTSTFVQGASAILRRILFRWCQLLGALAYDETLGIPTPLLDIDGATFTRDDLVGLRGQLAKQAKEEDFVTDVAIRTTLAPSGDLTIAARVTLTDGGTYPLEVQALQAIKALGGVQFSSTTLQQVVAFLGA